MKPKKETFDKKMGNSMIMLLLIVHQIVSLIIEYSV